MTSPVPDQHALHYYIDGARATQGDASIALGAPGFAYAACVFEGIAGYKAPGAEPMSLFRPMAHIDRLSASLDGMGIDPPCDGPGLLTLIEDALADAAIETDCHIRLMVWVDGETELTSLAPVRLGIILRPLFGRERLRPATPARVTEICRAPDEVLPAWIKTPAHYVTGRRAALQTRMEGAAPILRNMEGNLAEGATANLFLVRAGRLITPSLDQSILPGITRATVIELAAGFGIEVEERPISPAEIDDVDEAFFTGSLAEITPINPLDGHGLTSTDPGSITLWLATAYADAVRANGPEWCHRARVSSTSSNARRE